MGSSNKDRSSAYQPAGIKRKRPSTWKFTSTTNKLRCSYYHTFDVVPAPHIIMAEQRPKAISIRPNGKDSEPFAARVSYDNSLGRSLIAPEVVRRHGIKVHPLPPDQVNTEGRYTLIACFSARWCVSDGATEGDCFYVTDKALPGQAEVLWKNSYTCSPTSNTRPRAAYPTRQARTAAQKKADEAAAQDAKKVRKLQQEETKKKIEQEHQLLQTKQKQTIKPWVVWIRVGE